MNEFAYYSIKRTTDAASEPITTSEAKTHLREDSSANDTYIDTLIAAARMQCEIFQRRSYINQTWTMALTGFPGSYTPDSWHTTATDDLNIYLPYPPLSSVTSITYTDTDGGSNTLATSVYGVDTNSEPGRVYLKYDQSWPATRDLEDAAVRITYVAGYGATAASVPATIKHAIKLLVAWMYEYREPVISGTIIDEVPGVKALLWTDRFLQAV